MDFFLSGSLFHAVCNDHDHAQSHSTGNMLIPSHLLVWFEKHWMSIYQHQPLLNPIGSALQR